MTAVTVVVNPAAGGGRALAALPGVIDALRAGGADLTVVRSASLGHAVDAAAAAAGSGAVVAALGGDGLVGALAGAVAAHDGRLAVLPGGRGNDFARGLGVPRDPRAAARALPGWRERRVDLGDAGGRAFVGIASVGFDGDVSRLANEAAIVRGRLVYPYALLRVLATWEPAAFHVTIDGTAYDYTGYMVSVANSQWYGGGMRCAPRADLADGRFDVIMTHHIAKARFLMAAPKVLWGGHVDERTVHERRGGEVHVAADRPFTVHADGEPLCPLPATLTVRRQALRVLAPR
ncbi:MAG: diacylglycerol/lipid kinase family protein [Frankiaceae bacterium]